MYDRKEIAQRVAKKRKHFIGLLVTTLVLLTAGVVIFAIDINKTITFISMLGIALCVAFLFGIYNVFAPNVLFSHSVEGKNVKEHIYEVYVRRGFGLSPRQAGMRYGGQPISHTRMAKGHLRSAVYLKLENGNFVEIRGLRVEHAELYEDGDLLYKPAGTKYPIILGRHTERQPCPLCGTINAVSTTACICCGLKTEKG